MTQSNPSPTSDARPDSGFLGDTWHGRVLTDAWHPGEAGMIDVYEPATGHVLGSVGEASAHDVDHGADLASRLQGAWAAEVPTRRAAVLRRAGDLFTEHREELREWIVRETGAIGAKADLEISIAAQECYEAAGLPTRSAGEVLASDEPHFSFARRIPVGVVGVIAPFNFPLILSIRSVAPALALGNAVVLKPDPRTPVSGGVVLARVFEEAGLPAGLLQVLPGGREAGSALVESGAVNAISFTGSTAAGRIVGEAAGRTLKKVHLELGGNNALVVLPGADVAAAASAGAFGAWLHQGQICMTAGRHIVHASLYEEYLAALAEKAAHLPVGDPRGEVALGPLIDAGQRDHVVDVLERSRAAGARLVAGGTHEGLFFAPTVLAEVAAGNPAWREEIFGPVAPVASFETLEEAAALVNDSEYGLSVGILGEVGEAMKLAPLVRAGKVHINEQTVADEANAPFGGVGASGNCARFGGDGANVDAFTQVQWVTVRPDIAPYPF